MCRQGWWWEISQWICDDDGGNGGVGKCVEPVRRGHDTDELLEKIVEVVRVPSFGEKAMESWGVGLRCSFVLNEKGKLVVMGLVRGNPREGGG